MFLASVVTKRLVGLTRQSSSWIRTLRTSPSLLTQKSAEDGDFVSVLDDDSDIDLRQKIWSSSTGTTKGDTTTIPSQETVTTEPAPEMPETTVNRITSIPTPSGTLGEESARHKREKELRKAHFESPLAMKLKDLAGYNDDITDDDMFFQSKDEFEDYKRGTRGGQFERQSNHFRGSRGFEDYSDDEFNRRPVALPRGNRRSSFNDSLDDYSDRRDFGQGRQRGERNFSRSGPKYSFSPQREMDDYADDDYADDFNNGNTGAGKFASSRGGRGRRYQAEE